MCSSLCLLAVLRALNFLAGGRRVSFSMNGRGWHFPRSKAYVTVDRKGVCCSASELLPTCYQDNCYLCMSCSSCMLRCVKCLQSVLRGCCLGACSVSAPLAQEFLNALYELRARSQRLAYRTCLPAQPVHNAGWHHHWRLVRNAKLMRCLACCCTLLPARGGTGALAISSGFGCGFVCHNNMVRKRVSS
jgi:hypothetical protein